MATYLMFGKYSVDAIKEASAERTTEAGEIVEKLGGQIKAIYALLGEQDLVLVVELPGLREAMQASVILSRDTGIAFSTSPAMPVSEFDELLAQLP